MNDANLFVVGLTGPTGSGKTTVSEVFARNGFYVINCDKISRDVSENSKACKDELVHEFSDVILNEDGSLNRQKLSDIVFGDGMKRACLEGVIYPYILAKIIDEIKDAVRKKERFVLLDAPTLFQSNANDFCDIIVTVIADEQKRYENIMQRDGLTIKRAQLRMAAQLKDEYYTSKSDIVIQNDKDLEKLMKASEEIAKMIKEYRHG